MQTHPHASSVPAPDAARFVPPAHVKRWTGRSVPTIWLPDLATLRISTAGAASTPHPARPARI